MKRRILRETHRSRKAARWLAILLALCAVLPACLPTAPASRPWAYADLRLVDPPDAPAPALDLIAGYTRTAGWDLEIRFDLLDSLAVSDYDLYIILDSGPGGQNSLLVNATQETCMLCRVETSFNWDVALVLPAGVQARAYSAGQQIPSTTIRPRAVRDPFLDTITVRLNRLLLPGGGKHLAVEAYLSEPGKDMPVDKIGPFRTDGSPPLTRAPLLLAFNNTFPALTPAQALRRWDGAHTGPSGGRHGLRYLLSAALKYDFPLALLDLKIPSSLSALDLMGGLEPIESMLTRNLLLIPDVAYGQPEELSIQLSRQAASAFNLPGSSFLYSVADRQIAGEYPYQFAQLNDATHLTRHAGMTLIPMPDSTGQQATQDGPTLEVRRQLLATALSPDFNDLVILGGNLPQSTWGDSDKAEPSLAYLRAHPWIQPLFADDLKIFPASGEPTSMDTAVVPNAAFPIYSTSGNYTGLDSAGLQTRLREKLASAPPNPISQAAWEMYFSLTSPEGDENLRTLRAQYLGHVGMLLTASQWAEKPGQIADCSIDLDFDTEAECMLNSTDFLALLEVDGARLEFLFWRGEHGVSQLIGPTSQFMVGMSDPSLWDMRRGEAADPGQIAGALSEQRDTFQPFEHAALDANTLQFSTLDGRLTKTISLTEDGLQITYHAQESLTTYIPLVVNPQQRFQPGWWLDYQATLSPGSFSWGFENSPWLEVHSNVPLAAQGFTISLPFLSLPENPNLDYPPGHFLPFPIALIEMQGNHSFTIELLVR